MHIWGNLPNTKYLKCWNICIKIGTNRTINLKKSEKISCIISKDSNRSQCIRKPPRNIVGKPPEAGAVINHQTLWICSTDNAYQDCTFFISLQYSKPTGLPLCKGRLPQKESFLLSLKRALKWHETVFFFLQVYWRNSSVCFPETLKYFFNPTAVVFLYMFLQRATPCFSSGWSVNRQKKASEHESMAGLKLRVESGLS